MRLIHSEVELGTLTGLIEADGCISLAECQNGFHPLVGVSNTSNILHEWITSRFGGKTSLKNNKKSDLWKETLWTHRDTIRNVLESILPYLISKREEAELLLEYVRSFDGKRYAIAYERAQEICQRMKVLHNGGRP